jgi:hypothetical protein
MWNSKCQLYSNIVTQALIYEKGRKWRSGEFGAKEKKETDQTSVVNIKRISGDDDHNI